MMRAKEQYLVFGLNGTRFAIPLTLVQRVVRAVAITPVPEPPAGVRGFVNVAGQIIPVMDLRQQLHFPEAEISPADYLILVQNQRGRMALLVNEVLWIIAPKEQEVIPAGDIFPGLRHIRGALKVDREIVLLHELDDENFPENMPYAGAGQ